MPVLKNISVLYTCLDKGGQGDTHPIQDAAVYWKDGIIEWVGQEKDMPQSPDNHEVFNAGGRMVIPGLTDCHTHLAFGGWRAEEFEMRVRGRSYLEIAEAGGGIISTVMATRKASEDELYDKASALLDQIMRLGVTTIECKSGYGLSLKDELKLLRVYRRLAESKPVKVVPTFLGAHTIPPEFISSRSDYIRLVMDDIIPRVGEEKLASYCDIFVEKSAFTADEAFRILERGKEYGMRPKIHADQLTSCGGAELAAATGAISADHLERITDQGIQAMAEAGVIGVTLPVASLYTQQPFLDCRRLVSRGVEVAVATDFNPGSAPSFDLPLAMMLSCNLGRLTPAEALKGATLYATKAIGMDKKSGSIENGKSADFVVVDAPSVNFWMYHFTSVRAIDVFVNGEHFS